MSFGRDRARRVAEKNRAIIKQMDYMNDRGGNLAGYLDYYRGVYTYEETEAIYNADLATLNELKKVSAWK